MWEIFFLGLTIAFNSLLGLVVLLKNSRSATHKLFFVLTICLSAFTFTNYLSVHPVVFGQLTWIRLVLVSGAMLFLSAYLTFDVFPNAHARPSKRRLWLIIYSLAVIVLTMTPFVFSHLSVKPDGSVQPQPAPGLAFFVAQQAMTLVAALSILAHRFRSSHGLRRLQYRYIILSLSLTLGCIIFFNLILVQIFHITNLLIFGTFSTILFSTGLAYAIVRHRLLDIKAVVARSVAYILLLLALAGLYVTVLFSLSSLVFSETGNYAGQSLISVVLAVILAFSFQPLRRFFERFTDRLFYRDSYDAQVVLHQISHTLAYELNLEKLLESTLREICHNLKIEMGQFIVFNNDNVYKFAHFGKLPRKLLVAPELRKLSSHIHSVDEMEGGEAKEIMDDHGISLSVMLNSQKEFVGYMLLGSKLSGDIYNQKDFELMEILSSSLAVAIQNAKSFEEIQHFNQTLQERVDRATNRLKVANRHLKELDKAKDEFLSMASHQLRTPLTTIKGYLSMVLEGDAGKITPTQGEYIGYAFEGSKRMVALISDLLNVSRLSAGRFMIESLPCDISQVVADEVRQLQNHAEAKGLKLIYQPPAKPLPPVELDENKTRQVIMNFVDNAIYYTATGSVTVRLKAHDGLIELRVTDTGIGVPEAARHKLFSKFYRAENAQAMRPDGTGLGLYLAKRVIEDQGGTIICESSEGHGSTFGFQLPVRVTNTKAKVTSAS